MNRYIIICMGVALLVFTLKYNEVDNSLTKTDLVHIEEYIPYEIKKSILKLSFNQQINLIVDIQKKVRKIAKNGEFNNDGNGIAYNKTRDLENIKKMSTELCFDISRGIEKTLKYYGFETRHISIYSLKKTNSRVISLITPNIASHAITEVKTKKGWMVIDSTSNWISLKGNKPISLKNIKKLDKYYETEWDKGEMNDIFESFVGVYGLYSRHGKFYIPFNFVPDIEYSEFSYNLIDW